MMHTSSPYAAELANPMTVDIAFFDFDGTITYKDTLLEFLKYSKGTFQFYAGFLLNAPWLVAFKLGLISNSSAKQKVLRYFIGGTRLESFKVRCQSFSAEVLPGLLRPKALIEIEKHLAKGTTVVVVSASPENWITDWCKAMKIELLATMLETRDGKLTGNFEGENCYGDEKTIRIRKAYNLKNYGKVYCYGDSEGDKPFLALGDYRFYKPFR